MSGAVYPLSSNKVVVPTGIEPRFTNIRPLLAEPEHGEEPCFYSIVYLSYVDFDVEPDDAEIYTLEYLRQWVEGEQLGIAGLKRFTAITPLLVDIEKGREHSFRTKLICYYALRDIEPEDASRFAKLYIDRWSIAESFMLEE